jgi:GTPase
MHENNLLIRFLPVHVINPRANKEKSIDVGEELESLINTLGGEIVDRVIQKLNNPDPASYIGKGKVQEVAKIVEEKRVDVVVLNNAAKSKQVFNLKTALQKVNPNIEVFDRIDLILHIFDKHASTKEAKLQIELARMRYMGPRIYGMGFVMSRQGGGIGTIGVGETNTELMKRHWRQEMKKVTEELDKANVDREKRIERRKREGYKTISIVGYTNAGKSTLFNLLTAKNVLSENVLFATLDSSIGEVYLPESHQKVMVTDTIGFIRNLPPRLIQAFKSTLLESIHADVILHVVDASDHEVFEKIKIVEEILNDLGISQDKVLYVFNKSDRLSVERRSELEESFKEYNPVFVSAVEDAGKSEIIKLISQALGSEAHNS